MLTELVFIAVLIATPHAAAPWEVMCAMSTPYAMFVGACFASQILGYFVGCLPYVLMDMLRYPKYKVQPAVNHPKFSVVVSCIKDMLVSFITVILPLLIVGGPLIHAVGISREGSLPSRGVLLVQICFFFLVEDYLNYWLHRLLHQPWLYKNIHAVHHTYNSPFAIVAAYAHPLEVIILAIPTFAGPAAIGPHLYTLLVWQLLRNCEAIDIHSGYEISQLSIKSFIPAYAYEFC